MQSGVLVKLHSNTHTDRSAGAGTSAERPESPDMKSCEVQHIGVRALDRESTH